MDFNDYSMMLLCDFYKISHREQYPKGTEMVYSTWTPRVSKIKRIDSVVAFGFQYFVEKYLIHWFDDYFFLKPLLVVLEEYSSVVSAALGINNPPVDHIIALHKLGYLPLEIHAVPEGTKVPLRCPMFAIHNTHSNFFWLTNYIETLASTTLWHPSTTATLANKYREILNHYCRRTRGDTEFVKFQGHDFSMRGQTSLESGAAGQMGHLLSFVGTDTIPAIHMAQKYYGAAPKLEIIGTSIPATEHSVMCAHGQDEMEAYRKLLTDVYPTGMVSIVSDTWDFWHVMTEIIGSEYMKRLILARPGKVVIRPDSGDPVKIICGDPAAEDGPARIGLIEVLWRIFGGRTNKAGFKELDPHIGAIYGDAITLDRCEDICYQLMTKGFASTNIVFGIGSFTYQYQTRDTFGFALKSTLCRINGEEKQIFKDPKTDDGTKKSQKGAVVVIDNEFSGISYEDGKSLAEIDDGRNIMQLIFKDGKAYNRTTFSGLRRAMHGSSF